MTLNPGQRRHALGEIGNKVTQRNNAELTGKTGQQPAKDKVLLKKPLVTKQVQVKVDKIEKSVVAPKPVQLQVAKQLVAKTANSVVLVDDCRRAPEVNDNEPLAAPIVPKLETTTDSNANNKKDSADCNAAANKETDSFSSDLITIEDIDEEDRKNPILVSVYSNDIYAHLRALEMLFPIEKGYLQGQEVTAKMRCVLVDWLIEVHEQFHLMQETLYLTIAIIDRFLQVGREFFFF